MFFIYVLYLKEKSRMQKTASKNIISSGSYEFLNLAHNTITIHAHCANFKSQYLKAT